MKEPNENKPPRLLRLATILSSISIVAAMTAVYLLTGSQTGALAAGLATMVLFYIILWLCRNRFVAVVAVATLFSIQTACAQTRPSVSILGDSYSTFQEYVQPARNAVWYFQDQDNPERTDVTDVTQTWWHRFITKNNLRLEKNNSYSGSTVCNRGYRGEDYTDRSFISRMDDLGSPDILLIFGGTNDSWANVPVGEDITEKWTKDQLYEFRPALNKMLDHVAKRYPNTRIVYLLNDGLKPEVTEGIIESCKRYDIPCLVLKNISKRSGHPDREGMKQISDQLTGSWLWTPIPSNN